jgi:PHD/YefM family antitoxin component YafN of YafNO toxin-antitoxin module
MALDLVNIHSLSDFQRNAKDHIRKLKRSGKPAVLTVNGEAEVVVQSAEAYQKLLDDPDHTRVLQRREWSRRYSRMFRSPEFR